jgi:hypothetical protein
MLINRLIVQSSIILCSADIIVFPNYTVCQHNKSINHFIIKLQVKVHEKNVSLCKGAGTHTNKILATCDAKFHKILRY